MSEIRELVVPALRQIEADVSGLKSDLHDLTSILDSQTGQLDQISKRLDRMLARFEAATGLSRDRVHEIRRRLELLREISREEH